MRLISDGAICATKAKEMRQRAKWRERQHRQPKAGKGEKHGKTD